MNTNPFLRPDLERMADDTLKTLIESGQFTTYPGTLPRLLRQRLKQLKLPRSDEYLLEDIFAERMIAATQSPSVQEITDQDVHDKVLQASYEKLVMVDVYTDFCRPCKHVLPVVYQLADKYKDRLTVVKINAAKNGDFVQAFLGPFQVTPAFLFFRNGQPLDTSSSRLARVFGQKAHIASTRAGLEKRISVILA